jgi:integrase
MKDKNKFPRNLSKRGDAWVIDFYYRGERCTQNIGPVSRTNAKERAAALKIAVAEGRAVVNGKRWIASKWIAEVPVPELEDPVFEDAMTEYLEWTRINYKPQTHIFCVNNAKPLRAFFRLYRLSQVSEFLCEKYKIERKRSCACLGGPKRQHPKSRCCTTCGERTVPRSNATVNRELSILKAMFNLRIKLKRGTGNPMQSIELFEEDNGRVRHLNQREAERLLAACNPDFRVVVLVTMHTGFRSAELKSLRRPSVDMENRSITVQACYSKTNDTRTVPMTDEVFVAFQQLFKDRDQTPDDLVFVNRYGKPWKSWRTAFQNAVKNAGLKDFRFHDLRHTFASWLAMNNTHPKAMMELLGHSDMKMTDRYTHLDVSYQRAAVRQLPSFGREIMESESHRISQQKEMAKVAGSRK